MKKSLFVVILLLLPVLVIAQIGLKYGGLRNQSGYRIRPTADKGFIVGGFTDSTVGNVQDYWVMRFNRLGMPIWDKSYGNAGGNQLWSIETTKDNGALIAGFSGPQYQNSEALMYKIDSVGNVVKKLEVDYSSADHAHWFKQNSDGSYYWAGHTDSKGDLSGDMILQKLDSSFHLQWEKLYGYAGTMEHCHTAAVTPDNGVILVGHTSVNNREKVFAVRVDSGGNIIWQKTYGATPTSNDPVYEVVVTAEGYYAIFSSSDEGTDLSPMWLLVLDPQGNKVIDQHYPLAVDFAFGGIQSSDSGYVMVGYSSKSGSTNSSLYVLKTDKIGKLQWQKTYGDSALAYGVMQRGKQFLVVGGTDQTQDKLDDLWLLVLDSAGNITTLDTATHTGNASVSPSSHLETNGMVLDQNYPNPASNITTISFTLTYADHISLKIMNALGEEIRTVVDRRMDVGSHYIRLNASEFPSGTYFYELRNSSCSLMKELVIAK